MINKKKAFLPIASAIIVILLVSVACSSGFVLGRTSTPTQEPVLIPEEVEIPVPTSEILPETNRVEQATPDAPAPTRRPAAPPMDRDELFAPFWETWDIIHDQYVDQPLDEEALMQGAIRGMLEALGDQHTSYMDPDQYLQANMRMDEEYEGIGAWVDTNAEYLTIVSPMPGSPAEAAGLKPGDKVIAIDGEDMTGIDGNLVIRRVLGPAGSTVHLTISRGENDPQIFEVEITRARITVPSVEGEMLEDGIAYVKLYQFADNTTANLRETLTELLANNPKGLIVDVRNNPGGYLHTSIEVTSEFIGEGVILIEEYGDGRRDVFRAKSGGLAIDIPLVLLVNEGSASASEILAGAIQDHNRGTLVGMTTFGKGSVQNWVALSDEKGAVRVTIARWLTPNERQIHEVGLEPDLEVSLTEEDVLAELDPQLEQAIELLSDIP